MTILLGSKSPRRQELLKGAGIAYTLVNIDCEENFPDSLPLDKVAEYLAIKKSMAYCEELEDNILLTSDTTVLLDNLILNKPQNEEHAKQMLRLISGKMHKVYTGVCLRSKYRKIAFTDITNVYFKEIDESDIAFYVSNYNPLDKAGAYGIQDWIGYVGISRIEGDFFNVMGLPVNRVYESLKQMRQ